LEAAVKIVSSIARAVTSSGRALTAAGHHDAPAGRRFAKAIVERTDFLPLGARIASCSSGSISASQVAQRSLQRQSHSSHQSVPQGQVWCFRNHGIGVVLIQTRARGHRGFRDRLVAGRRTIREAPDDDAVRDCGCDTSGGRGLRAPPALGGVTLSGFGFSGAWAAPSMAC
jgi:hypothetical protein